MYIPSSIMNSVIEQVDKLPNALGMIRDFEKALKTPGKTYFISGSFDKRVCAIGPIHKALQGKYSSFDISFPIIDMLDTAYDLYRPFGRISSFGVFKSDLPVISYVLNEYKVRKFNKMRAQAYSLQEKLSA